METDHDGEAEDHGHKGTRGNGSVLAQAFSSKVEDGTPHHRSAKTYKDESKNADGDYDIDVADFVVWRSDAEYVARNFKKGDLVSIENSRYHVKRYIGSDGESKRKAEFIAGKVRIMRRKIANQQMPVDIKHDDEVK